MASTIRKMANVLAAVCLVGACSSFGHQAYERPDCHSKSTDEDCTNYVNDQKLEGGFRDHGFDAAHRKQGYENLREQRRQRRDAARANRTQQDAARQDQFEGDFGDTVAGNR